MLIRFLLISVMTLFTNVGALAANVDFSTVITDQDDKPIQDCMGVDKCVGAPEMTLGRLSMHVLTAIFEDERALSGEEKFKRGELVLRVYRGNVVDLSAEEIALLKKLIAKGYGPFIVMKAWNILDPKK